MAWGSVIKEIVLYRTYPKDLGERLEEAERMIKIYREELIALAASPPREIKSETGDHYIPWDEYVPRRVNELLEALAEEEWVAALCRRGIECPEDVEEY
jgi:hypothetical protein